VSPRSHLARLHRLSKSRTTQSLARRPCSWDNLGVSVVGSGYTGHVMIGSGLGRSALAHDGGD